MLAAGLSFVGMTAIVRHLGTELRAAPAAFLRIGWGVMILLPTMPPLLRGGLPAGTAGPFAWRGVFHTGAVILWSCAMARLPLAEVTAVGNLNPVAGQGVSLRAVCINPRVNWQGDQQERSGHRYVARKVQGGHYEITVTSIRSGQVKLTHVQAQYEPNAVYARRKFTENLSDAQRTTLRQFYDTCNPRPMVDPVQGGGPALPVATITFQCAPVDLLAVLVEVLYSTRNALLHGEVDPDGQVLACYETAYRIVMIFLGCVK
jgi:hypothetical protein